LQINVIEENALILAGRAILPVFYIQSLGRATRIKDVGVPVKLPT
jgi:hypothetical protein